MEWKEIEVLSVVDKSGIVVAQEKAGVSLNNPDHYFETVHCLVINEFKELLLQKRANNKRISPGKWDLALGGHIKAGEKAVEALLREVYEEIGVNASKAIKLDEYTYVKGSERQYTHLYILPVDKSSISLNSNEITELKWVDQSFIDELDDILDLNIQKEYLNTLITYINKFIKNHDEK